MDTALPASDLTERPHGPSPVARAAIAAAGILAGGVLGLAFLVLFLTFVFMAIQRDFGTVAAVGALAGACGVVALALFGTAAYVTRSSVMRRPRKEASDGPVTVAVIEDADAETDDEPSSRGFPRHSELEDMVRQFIKDNWRPIAAVVGAVVLIVGPLRVVRLGLRGYAIWHGVRNIVGPTAGAKRARRSGFGSRAAPRARATPRPRGAAV
jgi:hypothetical protein